MIALLKIHNFICCLIEFESLHRVNSWFCQKVPHHLAHRQPKVPFTIQLFME